MSRHEEESAAAAKLVGEANAAFERHVQRYGPSVPGDRSAEQIVDAALLAVKPMENTSDIEKERSILYRAMENLAKYQAVDTGDGQNRLVGLSWNGTDQWGPVYDASYDPWELAEAVEKWLKQYISRVLSEVESGEDFLVKRLHEQTIRIQHLEQANKEAELEFLKERARVKELEQANKELLEALDGLMRFDFADTTGELEQRQLVSSIVRARAALSKHGGTK